MGTPKGVFSQLGHKEVGAGYRVQSMRPVQECRGIRRLYPSGCGPPVPGTGAVRATRPLRGSDVQRTHNFLRPEQGQARPPALPGTCRLPALTR